MEISLLFFYDHEFINSNYLYLKLIEINFSTKINLYLDTPLIENQLNINRNQHNLNGVVLNTLLISNFQISKIMLFYGQFIYQLRINWLEGLPSEINFSKEDDGNANTQHIA